MHPELEPNYSKQRLIFRPKSLLLGWWGGMHPPPKSATDCNDNHSEEIDTKISFALSKLSSNRT